MRHIIECLSGRNQLPDWVPLLQALSVPTVALFAAYIAYRQYGVSKEKLRLDLFDKRMEVYSLAEDFFKSVLKNGYPANADFRTIYLAVGKSKFLFGAEVEEILISIADLAARLKLLNDRVSNNTAALTPADSDNLDQWTREFWEKERNLSSGFTKYMKFPK